MTLKTQTKKPNDMSPVEIKIALMKAGVKQQDIANKLGITRQSVNGVISGRHPSEPVDEAICQIIQVDKKLLRPSRYLYSDR